MYVCDMKNKCVLLQPTNPWNDKQGALDILVYDYEGQPLQGPSGATVDEATGTLYFTDAGPFGTTGVHNPKGSLFCIKDDILHPIAHECLAYPWGVALSPDGKVIYLAETMKNRVLRFVQGPEGAWRSMVLYQGSGGVGPSVLCTDRDGNLYVAMYNTINHLNKKAASKQLGRVLVLDAESGAVKEVIALPLPNITGIAAVSTGNHPTLYVCADKIL
jgi:sugar lactone lactonase YvrE